MSPADLLDGPLRQVDPDVQSGARELCESLGDSSPTSLTIPVGDGGIVVQPPLSDLLVDIIRQLASGTAVGVFSVPDELTTTTAAAQLGVSRPTLMKMIRDGKLDSYKVGSHTRLKRDEVARYLTERRQQRQEALDEMLEDGDAYAD